MILRDTSPGKTSDRDPIQLLLWSLTHPLCPILLSWSQQENWKVGKYCISWSHPDGVLFPNIHVAVGIREKVMNHGNCCWGICLGGNVCGLFLSSVRRATLIPESWGDWCFRVGGERLTSQVMFLHYEKNVFLVCCVILCAWDLGRFCMCVYVAWLLVCMCVFFLERPRDRESLTLNEADILKHRERCGFFQTICTTDTAQWPMSTISERSHTAHFKETHAGNKSVHIF